VIELFFDTPRQIDDRSYRLARRQVTLLSALNANPTPCSGRIRAPVDDGQEPSGELSRYLRLKGSTFE